MEGLLSEVKGMKKEFLDNLLLDQLHNQSYIYKNCIDCVFHSEIFYNNKLIHICNDVWSGVDSIGKHIFYFETKDICIECGGFKQHG